MQFFFCFLVSLISAFIASMGIGGGAVLLLFLTVFSATPVLTAQGINLLFFLPVGIIALCFHRKSGLLQWKQGVLCGIFGIPGVFLGGWIASHTDSAILSKIFALFLFALGLKTLFAKPNKKSPEQP